MNACADCGSKDFVPMLDGDGRQIVGHPETCRYCDLQVGRCPACNEWADECECQEVGV